MLCFSHVVYIERLNGVEISRKHQIQYTLPEQIGDFERGIVVEAAEKYGGLLEAGETLAYEDLANRIERRYSPSADISEIAETLRWLTKKEYNNHVLYNGTAWNREMPLRKEQPWWCNNCQDTTQGILTSYNDAEYFYCYRCQTTSERKFNGPQPEIQVHKKDKTRAVSDWKRNTDRRYLTQVHRKELGLDDTESH